eukprot:COSAG01_NODE_2161_length_8268_cov_23.645122_6_plen_179_part_00
MFSWPCRYELPHRLLPAMFPCVRASLVQAPTSEAAGSNCVMKGHAVRSIQGRPAQGMSFSQTAAAIRGAGRPVTVTFGPPPLISSFQAAPVWPSPPVVAGNVAPQVVMGGGVAPGVAAAAAKGGGAGGPAYPGGVAPAAAPAAFPSVPVPLPSPAPQPEGGGDTFADLEARFNALKKA